MHPVDWVVVVAFTAWIVYDGLRRTKDSHELEGYFLAKRSIPWWAAGISVMATQLSAITMIGTTGQAYADGMRFIQFYFGLPLAMIILSWTLVPFFYNSRVYTAYEYLESRFDAKTRSFTSFLFLVSRGLSVGAIVSAPAVVLSLVLGWNLTATSLAIAMPAVVYTMFGGVQAVTWTDVKTMSLIVGGLLVMIATAVLGLPDGVSVGDGLAVAAATGRLRSFDFSLDLTNQYTFWSGTIAALFLFCSYFGADQSQVQRYLTARSLPEARQSLLMSAYWKIPLQVIVLLVGVLVFVYYTFNPAPLIFSSEAESRLRQGQQAEAYRTLETEYQAAFSARREAALELANARDGGAIRHAQSRVGVAGDSRQGDWSGPRGRGRSDLYRCQLHHSDVHPDAVADRPDRSADCWHPHGGDRFNCRGVEFAVHGNGDRLLQTMGEAQRARCALPHGLQDRNRSLGTLRVCDCCVGRRARILD
jgi:SSS family solute:Na+ symporter